MAKTLIRFDWAMKRLLRQKSNFDILEGFLSELLREDIKIEQILDSESNQDEAGLKFNRVDLLALNSKGQLIIIELQADSQADYFYRILFATAKAVVEHFRLGDEYKNVKKVYSVNIVYFDLGQGNDYVYHGGRPPAKTEFTGLHTGDVLGLSTRQKKGFALNNVFEVYPEYYILKINKFNDLATDGLDEWIYYFKNTEVKPGSMGKGLSLVQAKLEFDELSKADQGAYLKSLEDKAISRGIVETARDEGEQLGAEKTTRQGIVRALQRGKLTLDEIAELFAVSLETVLTIQQEMPNP
jgi:predicted transposase/invertase (TIGR01784 family)